MAPNNIVLFTYDLSVYGRKMEWYLNLRGIKYAKCLTNSTLPREQLQALGIRYRRIPWLAIGRDVYCDTRNIIDKLEQLIPENRLASSDPFQRGVEYLFETWVNDAGPFWKTSQLIPPAMLTDDKFLTDRTEMIGVPFSRESMAMMRPDGLIHMRVFVDQVENQFLADGRQYLGGEKPGMADIHAAWVFDWMIGMRGVISSEQAAKEGLSQDNYPKLFAWVARFRKLQEDLLEKNGKPEILSNDDAYARVLALNEFEDVKGVYEHDPLGLAEGQLVDLWPTDNSSNHHDKGKLVALHVKEVVIESEVPDGKGHLHLHFPRSKFMIKPLQEARL